MFLEEFVVSADLHCYTKLSDGSLGIDDLVILAKRQGIDTIAITDHNCQAGNIRGELIGKRHDVTVIPGIEFSSYDSESKTEIDILCYLADSPARLEGLCRRNMLACRKAGQMTIISIAKRFAISPDFIVKTATGSTGIFRAHIMRALMECGYTTEMYGDLYKELFTKESSNNVLVQAKYEETSEVIRAIHESGGVAIISHPGTYENNLFVINKCLEYGADGIEAWSPYNTEEQTNDYLKLAKSKGVLTIGGSSFKGLYNFKPITVGQYSTPDKQLDKLKTYKARMKRLQKKAEKEADEAVADE